VRLHGTGGRPYAKKQGTYLTSGELVGCRHICKYRRAYVHVLPCSGSQLIFKVWPERPHPIQKKHILDRIYIKIKNNKAFKDRAGGIPL